MRRPCDDGDMFDLMASRSASEGGAIGKRRESRSRFVALPGPCVPAPSDGGRNHLRVFEAIETSRAQGRRGQV